MFDRDVFDREPVVVFDTGPLLALATGLPFKIMSVVSFLYNDYRKLRSRARRLGKSLLEMVDEARQDFVEQLGGKKRAEDVAFELATYCMLHPNNCIVPVHVMRELRKYSFDQGVRSLLYLLNKKGTNLLWNFNKNMELIGRGVYSSNRQTVPQGFFEGVVGSAFSWKQLELDTDTIHDPIYQKIHNMIKSVAKYYFPGLTDTDISVLAYVAYLNHIGTPAIAVFGDGLMRRLANLYGIPYIYIYDKGGLRVQNEENLGRLQLKPRYGSIKLEVGKGLVGA